MDDISIWLRLSLTNGIGPSSIHRLLQHLGSLDQLESSNTATLTTAGLSKQQSLDFLESDHQERIDETLEWLEEDNHHLVTFGSPDYPRRLADIHDAPPVIYVIGDKEVLKAPQLAIVGSRMPTQGAARTAREFAAALVGYGLSITSGLAIGVDVEAHRGCLDADGLTIAVAATGLDRVYPAKHRAIAYEIVQNGAMISEHPLGTGIHKAYFPRRNRLISGLSIGTLVVEAAVKSGSLTTARHATEQGREVLAMPGSIHNPLARGCHRLIRQGAKLVETVDDILEELAGQIDTTALHDAVDETPENAKPGVDLDPEYEKLFACVDFRPQSIDQLVKQCELPANEVASMLLMLELQGLIESPGANRYVRC